MSGLRSLTVAALWAGFLVGILYLFGVQFAAGDVYPEYSSLRTDPGGVKLLFDALARTPGVAAARNYAPLDILNESGAAILILGVAADKFTADSQMQLRCERLASRGNRVIVAMAREPEGNGPKIGSLYRNWDVKFAVDSNRKHVHRLYFAVAKDWNVLDRAGEKSLAIERPFGKGSIVLAAESDDFANGTTAAADRLALVSAAIGPCSRVVFDEQHFGISESGSIVGLARRFRLTGFALGLAICAALFLWRNASGFPPPAPSETADRLSGRTAHAGLLTLLRRHLPRAELVNLCWQEWLAANRRRVPADRLARAESIVRSAGDRPAEAIREVQAVLESKGAL